MTGAGMLFLGREAGVSFVIAGTFSLVVSLAMIWKTTRNYLARPQAKDGHDIP